MANNAVINLTTGLEDPEKVTVAFPVAVGAAEAGRPTLMFLTKEAVRLALAGVAVGVACDGYPPPPLPDLMKRYQAAGGRYYVCPICFDTKKLDKAALIAGAELQGASPCGNGSATTARRPSATDPEDTLQAPSMSSPRRCRGRLLRQSSMLIEERALVDMTRTDHRLGGSSALRST